MRAAPIFFYVKCGTGRRPLHRFRPEGGKGHVLATQSDVRFKMRGDTAAALMRAFVEDAPNPGLRAGHLVPHLYAPIGNRRRFTGDRAWLTFFERTTEPRALALIGSRIELALFRQRPLVHAEAFVAGRLPEMILEMLPPHVAVVAPAKETLASWEAFRTGGVMQRFVAQLDRLLGA